MTEIIIILAATIVVFALFLVVYFIKDRSGSDRKQKPACAGCDCQRSQGQRGGPHRYQIQIEKEVRS